LLKLAARRQRPTKIVKTCERIDVSSDRTVRTSAATVATCGTIAATSAKITETCEQTVRICGKTKGPCVMTDNDCGRMSCPGPVPGNCSRTGNSCGTTVKISKTIVGSYEPTARTGEAIGRVSEKIDGRCTGIDKT